MDYQETTPDIRNRTHEYINKSDATEIISDFEIVTDCSARQVYDAEAVVEYMRSLDVLKVYFSYQYNGEGDTLVLYVNELKHIGNWIKDSEQRNVYISDQTAVVKMPMEKIPGQVIILEPGDSFNISVSWVCDDGAIYARYTKRSVPLQTTYSVYGNTVKVPLLIRHGIYEVGREYPITVWNTDEAVLVLSKTPINGIFIHGSEERSDMTIMEEDLVSIRIQGKRVGYIFHPQQMLYTPTEIKQMLRNPFDPSNIEESRYNHLRNEIVGFNVQFDDYIDKSAVDIAIYTLRLKDDITARKQIARCKAYDIVLCD